MDSDSYTRELREAQSSIYLIAYDVMSKLADLRKSLIRQSGKSKAAWQIINEHGYKITQAEIDYVKELDTKGSGHTAPQS